MSERDEHVYRLFCRECDFTSVPIPLVGEKVFSLCGKSSCIGPEGERDVELVDIECSECKDKAYEVAAVHLPEKHPDIVVKDQAQP